MMEDWSAWCGHKHASNVVEIKWRERLDSRYVTHYINTMIKSFRHKGLELFFSTGSKKGIQAQHATKLQLLLAALDNATGPKDMAAPNWRLHPLTHDLAGHWSVWVNGNWRLTFRFIGEDVELVDYQDYH
jgi:proteic killer suppression protein